MDVCESISVYRCIYVAECCSVLQCVAVCCSNLCEFISSCLLIWFTLPFPSLPLFPIPHLSPFSFPFPPSLPPILPLCPSPSLPTCPYSRTLTLFPHLFSIFWLPPSPPSLSGSPSGAAPKILVESNLEFLREHVLALLQLLLHLARKDQVIYKYICICTYIYVCAYVLYIHNKNVHSYSTLRRVEWWYIYVHTHIYIYIYTYVYMYVNIYIYMYIYIHILIYMYIHAYIHTYIYIFIYIWLHA